MRASLFSPASTSFASAPVSSHSRAISFAKVTDSARKEFSACFVISADSGLIQITFAQKGRNSSTSSARSSSVRQPPTMRSGSLKTFSAPPSRKFSGEYAKRLPGNSASNLRHVPAGICEEMRKIASCFASGTSVRMCASTDSASGRSSSFTGVSCVIQITAAFAHAAFASVVKFSLPLRSPPCISSARPGSKIGGVPSRNAAIVAASASSALTSKCLAHDAAVTHPRCQSPATVTFIGARAPTGFVAAIAPCARCPARS